MRRVLFFIGAAVAIAILVSYGVVLYSANGTQHSIGDPSANSVTI